MDKQHCGIGKDKSVGVNIEISAACQFSKPIPDYNRLANPKLPPDEIGCSQIDIGAEERTGFGHTDGFDGLEAIDVWPTLIARVAAVVRDPCSQKLTRVIRYEKERAFRPVVVPLGAQHDNILCWELKSGRHLDGFRSRPLRRRNGGHFNDRTAPQARDGKSRIGTRCWQIPQRHSKLIENRCRMRGIVLAQRFAFLIADRERVSRRFAKGVD
ncbi:hypothetical protein [Nitrobacter sp.]|uniref:hypothetical protein n=1 Tax=Nitrobacter sp. TaxID=29420 RepID=UPI0025FAF0D2|nr:hypothetical protein [Nitrobacter sp.]